jgi:hypothetical protein
VWTGLTISTAAALPTPTARPVVGGTLLKWINEKLN